MSTETSAAHGFDDLWDYDHPAGTEQRFRHLLDEAGLAPPVRLELLTQIARTLSLQRRFDEAHALLDEVERQLGDHEPVVRVRYLLERGRTFNSSDASDRALPLFDQAWVLSRTFGLDAYAVDAAHMLAIALPTPAEQHEWNLRAIALAEKSSDPRARRWLGSLYNNTGWTYHGEGRYAEALDSFEWLEPSPSAGCKATRRRS